MKENEIKLKNAKEKAIASINKSKRFIVVAIDENRQEYTTACSFVDKLRAASFLAEDAIIRTPNVPVAEKMGAQIYLAQNISDLKIGEEDNDE